MPIVDFGSRTCYWTPRAGPSAAATDVWKYYFEPLHPDRPAAAFSIGSEQPPRPSHRLPRGRLPRGCRHIRDRPLRHHPDLDGRDHAHPLRAGRPGDGLRRTRSASSTNGCARDVLARPCSPFPHGVHGRIAGDRWSMHRNRRRVGAGTRPHRRGSLVLERYVDELIACSEHADGPVRPSTSRSCALSWGFVIRRPARVGRCQPVAARPVHDLCTDWLSGAGAGRAAGRAGGRRRAATRLHDLEVRWRTRPP